MLRQVLESRVRKVRLVERAAAGDRRPAGHPCTAAYAPAPVEQRGGRRGVMPLKSRVTIVQDIVHKQNIWYDLRRNFPMPHTAILMRSQHTY